MPFSMNTGAQLALLEELGHDEYRGLYEVLRSDERINTGFDGADYSRQGLIHNGYFPTPDAEIYGAMILRHRPSRIIEVGGGFSTAVARAAITYAGLDTRLHVIDPEPRRPVEALADEVERSRVELSSLREEVVDEGSLLFIDSSHRTVRGEDGPFLYCWLLPNLCPGVLVHVHDIFLPYEYPDVYVELGWTEQHLLTALLANSGKFEVALAAHYLARDHRPRVQSVLGPRVGSDLFGGASFWMRSTAAD